MKFPPKPTHNSLKALAGLVLLLLTCACSHVERDAQVLLSEAREAYAEARYNDAKNLIDSIRNTYPKAFDTRREANVLKREAELGEQHQTLIYLDSLLTAQQARLDSIRGDFAFEKDTAYEAIGHYLLPAQVLERNLHRSYIRFRTDENGVLSMTSVYCGSYNIHHTSVTVTAPDGTFASTPLAPNCYETTVLGEHIETAEYPRGHDGDVPGFVRLNADKNLQLTYHGERTFHTTLLPSDREAAVRVGQLAELLAAMANARARVEEAKRRIAFFEAKTTDPTE